MSQKKSSKADKKRKSAAMARYNAGRRDLVNKARKVAKHKQHMADKRDNPPKVPRGTARAYRRLVTGVSQVAMHEQAAA